MSLLKYPRTPHIQGSRLQPGDEDLLAVPFAEIAGRYLVVEEKMDGGNAGISFAQDGTLLLQSRGHYLSGGPRERHFALLKQWASSNARDLYDILGTRYIMYGEWLYAKHTIFYDALPHYFMEFDIFDREARSAAVNDRETGRFLSTDRRLDLIAGSEVISVEVLWRGLGTSVDHLRSLIGPSRFKTARWREAQSEAAQDRGLDSARVARESDGSDLMEGLYIKLEEDGEVKGRYKFVRPDFLTTILDSGTHWLDRPIVPNGLRPGVSP